MCEWKCRVAPCIFQQYSRKQYTGTKRVCSWCLEMYSISLPSKWVNTKSKILVPSNWVNTKSKILVPSRCETFRLILIVIRNLVDSHSTIQANGGWQHRMKIGHIYNFLCNKNLFELRYLSLSYVSSIYSKSVSDWFLIQMWSI